MSFTISIDVFCDKCGDRTSGTVGIKNGKKESWRMAKTEGWRLVNRKHFCPVCVGTHYKTGGVYYRKEPKS